MGVWSSEPHGFRQNLTPLNVLQNQHEAEDATYFTSVMFKMKRNVGLELKLPIGNGSDLWKVGGLEQNGATGPWVSYILTSPAFPFEFFEVRGQHHLLLLL